MRAIVKIFITFAIVVTLSSGYAQTDKIAAQKQVIERLKKEVAAGEKEVSSLRKGKAAKQQQVQTLATQIETRNSLLKAQTKQTKLLKEQISQSNQQVAVLGRELELEKALYAEMVREAYRNYRNNNLMSYLFTSEDFIDVAYKIVNLRAVTQLREERMAKIERLTKDVVEQRIVLTENKEALEKTAKELQLQKSRLERDQRLARSSIATMSTKEKQLLQEQQLQKRKLDSAINVLRELSKGNTTGASFTAKTSNLNLPVVGGRVKRYMENMAEIVGTENASIVSIYEGKVVDVKQNRITGMYDAYIAHGEYITSYAGLANVTVAKGATVAKNQKIGVIGQAIDIITMQSEYKIVFGIYPPKPTQKLRASDCFKK